MLIALNDTDVVAGCGKKQAKRGTKEESVRRAVIHTYYSFFQKKGCEYSGPFFVSFLDYHGHFIKI